MTLTLSMLMIAAKRGPVIYRKWYFGLQVVVFEWFCHSKLSPYDIVLTLLGGMPKIGSWEVPILGIGYFNPSRHNLIADF